MTRPGIELRSPRSLANTLPTGPMNKETKLKPSINWRFTWCNGYRRRKWTRRHEFKSWTRLIVFHISTNTLGIKFHLKFDLVSYPARAEGLGKYDKLVLVHISIQQNSISFYTHPKLKTLPLEKKKFCVSVKKIQIY